MSKHHEPKFVVQYKEWIKNGPPKCCHTCFDYGADGVCTKHNAIPPEDFAATPGACNDWESEVPF